MTIVVGGRFPGTGHFAGGSPSVCSSCPITVVMGRRCSQLSLCFLWAKIEVREPGPLPAPSPQQGPEVTLAQVCSGVLPETSLPTPPSACSLSFILLLTRVTSFSQSVECGSGCRNKHFSVDTDGNNQAGWPRYPPWVSVPPSLRGRVLPLYMPGHGLWGRRSLEPDDLPPAMRHSGPEVAYASFMQPVGQNQWRSHTQPQRGSWILISRTGVSANLAVPPGPPGESPRLLGLLDASAPGPRRQGERT